MVVSAALQRGTVCERRNSNSCGSETHKNIYMSKVGERNRKGSAIYDS